ncbi:MAG: 1-acyl-sn-glycerol-3-phosphate acyltransferase [Verrucomicrobiales bacterium]|nr:1-acyl-sn-glycerol-3-phosphate acyltransferase [Verrucomicrobiales bacterium]
MQRSTVISEKPYHFIPPRESGFWRFVMKHSIQPFLRKNAGVESWEICGMEKIRASQQAGHGILMVPNHPRPTDPVALGLFYCKDRLGVRIMASSHLFQQSRFHRFILPRIGAFSVYREGMDREALKTAIDTLVEAASPLVIFAEGVVTRTNDRLINLQDGVSFIAHNAAKQRAARHAAGGVVAHPVAFRYHFRGDLARTLTPVLDEIETRLSWHPRSGESLVERIHRIGFALLALKEIEYFGAPESPDRPPEQRLSALLDQVLAPLEAEWLKGHREPTTVLRVKALRKAILPGLIGGELSEEERHRRWKQLFDLEVAQQICHFPPDYLGENPSAERLIETVERCEEVLGSATPKTHGPMHLRIEIGDAIAVPAHRDKRATDPLMDQIRHGLERLLGIGSALDS